MSSKYSILALLSPFISIVGGVNQNFTSHLKCKLQPIEVDTVTFINGDAGSSENDNLILTCQGELL